jgi:hypothetical protein
MFVVADIHAFHCICRLRCTLVSPIKSSFNTVIYMMYIITAVYYLVNRIWMVAIYGEQRLWSKTESKEVKNVSPKIWWPFSVITYFDNLSSHIQNTHNFVLFIPPSLDNLLSDCSAKKIAQPPKNGDIKSYLDPCLKKWGSADSPDPTVLWPLMVRGCDW